MQGHVVRRSVGPTLCFFMISFFLSVSIAHKGFCSKNPALLMKELEKRNLKIAGRKHLSEKTPVKIQDGGNFFPE